jgi:hypothetical protein
MNHALLFVLLGVISFFLILYRESAYAKGIPLVHRAVGIFAILFIILPSLFYGFFYLLALYAGVHMISIAASIALSAITYLIYYFVYKYWANPPKA